MRELHQQDHGPRLESRQVPGLMFADDLALLADTPEKLQSALNVLHMYCEKWELTVNMKKTKILVAIWTSRENICDLVLLSVTMTTL